MSRIFTKYYSNFLFNQNPNLSLIDNNSTSETDSDSVPFWPQYNSSQQSLLLQLSPTVSNGELEKICILWDQIKQI
jgi:hypothetical protein